ncbi:cytosolic carboxypeptidase 6-like [Uloborus diversus]|uniref:cytosolic carboxypeptidase 6-like n=1 Tax=Uloborus diversus TaxID=327109 RepID=UPI00240A8FAF|nr:cytosolic carboxypeptidase 6-like [Uloborus diversus]
MRVYGYKHGRRLDMVTIAAEKESKEIEDSLENNQTKKMGKKKKIVIVGARIHPGETPSSYVCQGMIQFLVSDHPVAKMLRDHVIFKFIPMLNPDGSYVGNYRTCILGQDLNRCWTETSAHAYPTLAAVKAVIESLSSDKDVDLDMYLDLHAHTGLLGAFVYGNSYTDVYRFQRHTLFPKHLSYCAQDFSLENTAYNKDRSKSGTSRRFLSSFLNDKVNCYTLEVSFHGYEVLKGNSSTVTVYNEEEYIRLGESICHSLLDYYVTIKYIPAEDIPACLHDTFSSKGAKSRLQHLITKSPKKTTKQTTGKGKEQPSKNVKPKVPSKNVMYQGKTEEVKA